MDSVNVRYGEAVTLPLNTGDDTDVSASIFIGKPGEAYILTKTISLTDGEGTFVFTPEEMEIPLDTYYYQINVTGSGGADDLTKYPSPNSDCEGCSTDFPKFIVCEALDQIEVS